MSWNDPLYTAWYSPPFPPDPEDIQCIFFDSVGAQNYRYVESIIWMTGHLTGFDPNWWKEGG